MDSSVAESLTDNDMDSNQGYDTGGPDCEDFMDNANAFFVFDPQGKEWNYRLGSVWSNG